LTQKQEFGLIDKLAAIGESKPVFMFAYAYDNQAQYDKFNEIHKSRTAHVPCIFLKDKSLILPDQ
jgi:uncharacterized ParB-like nuclease family protein